MLIGGYEIPPALQVIGSAIGLAGVVMWWLRKPSKDASMAMAGYKELSAAQTAFMAQVQADRAKDKVELEKTRTQHAECEARCAALEARLAKLEATYLPKL